MHKKIIAICAALVALVALAVPALASANATINEGGVAVAVGTKITGTAPTGSPWVLTSGSTNITCTKPDLSGAVTTNTDATSAGEITAFAINGSGPNNRCTTNIPDGFGGNVTVQPTAENLPWCLDATNADVFTVRGGSCSGAESNLPFVLDLFTSNGTTSLGSCTLERTAAQATLSGTFTTSTTESVATFTGNNVFTKVSGSFLCPSTGTLTGKFTLETAGTETKLGIN